MSKITLPGPLGRSVWYSTGTAAGSKAIDAAAPKVNQNLSQLMSFPAPANVQELKDATVVLQGEFEAAVRQELGTDRLS
jgi:hypothetical protein